MPVFVPAFFQPEAYNCEEVMVKTRIQNRLAETRKRRGVGAAGLAGRVGVSRQTIYAIEAGTYVPNTEFRSEDAHPNPAGRDSQEKGRRRGRPGGSRGREPPDNLRHRSRNVRAQYRSEEHTSELQSLR